jgi:hypothetical protein
MSYSAVGDLLERELRGGKAGGEGDGENGGLHFVMVEYTSSSSSSSSSESWEEVSGWEMESQATETGN